MALRFSITMSLDGFMAGPDPSLDEPLGKGGEDLHQWAFQSSAWQEEHGRSGGEAGVDSDVIRQNLEGIGAYLMGRGMFGGGVPGGGAGEWDESWKGWWGDNPPYHVPVFVLTNHPRESLEMEGGTTFHFVTDGIEAALERAQEAAGDGDVSIAGGADVVQQYLRAGLVDEFRVQIAPRFLGSGTRLFDALGEPLPQLELVETLGSPLATHVRYRVTGGTAG
jgi:dihydrofolate reductase